MSTAFEDKQNELIEKQKEVKEKQQEVKEKQQELRQESRKELNEQAQKRNESMQQVSRASKIIGSMVKNYHGSALGEIEDLVLDPENGQVVYAVISFGGVFGLGDKLFAVPWKALHCSVDKTHYVLDVDKTILDKASGFDKNHWPDSASIWDQQREELNQLYRVQS
jgi:sporulation protein YlmC with PRC-barrel domain